MREFKFKVWNYEESGFLQVVSFGVDDDGSIWYVYALDDKEAKIEPPYFPDSDEIKILQFTGLKDKDGLEIYEGDILDSPNWVVSFVDSSDGANLGMSSGWYEQRDNFESYRQLEVGDEVEVIGNIYENPELLK